MKKKQTFHVIMFPFSYDFYIMEVYERMRMHKQKLKTATFKK